jgi:flavin-dependent dehydrogenase
LQDAGTPAVRRSLFHYGDDAVTVSIKPSFGVQALYAPRRTVLDTLLGEAAMRAGACLEFGMSVTALHRDENGAVAGVVVGGTRGSGRTIRAPLVIGADGRNSMVAQAVGAGVRYVGSHASSFLYGYWANLAVDGYEWWYRPGVTAGAIPTNGGLTCVFIGGAGSDLDPLVRRHGASSVFQRFSDVLGLKSRIDAADAVGRLRHGHGLPVGYLRNAHGTGWALVGDAGHWMDPMSTHGMSSALRDAGLLARAVIAAPPGSPRSCAALREYESERNRLSRPMMQVTDEIASYRWDLGTVKSLLRTLSSAMTDEVETLAALQPAA